MGSWQSWFPSHKLVPSQPANFWNCCRGGLIKWADLLGPKLVADKLNGWAKEYESAGLSGFFKPCKYLQAAADNNTYLEAGKKSTSKM